MARTNQDWRQLPFDEQIQFFVGKLNVDTDSWRDVQGIEHDAVFVVAGAKGAVLQDFREVVTKAINDGATLEDFRKDFDRIVEARGWGYNGSRDWRSKVIWETNLRTSYAAGRYQQMQAVASRRPYWQWRHGGSRDPRPLHLALDGKVFRATDPFWQQIGTPPIAYGCKCSVFTLSQRDMDREGLTVEDGPRIGDRIKTLEGTETEVRPAEGWGGGHGRTTAERRQELADIVTRRLDPGLAAEVRREMETYVASNPPVDLRGDRLLERRLKAIEAVGEETVRRIEQNFAEALREAKVFVDKRPEDIEELARTGVIRPLFAVSNFDPAQWWKKESYVEDRRRWEYDLFGYPPATPIERRVVYGYVAREISSPEAVFKSETPNMYGGVTLELRPEVKARSSFSLDDSLYGTHERNSLMWQPSRLDSPNAASIFLDGGDLRRQGDILQGAADLSAIAQAKRELMQWPGYIEAHIHGGLTTANILGIIYPAGKSPSDEVRQWARQSGIEILEEEEP
jgi:hypothetical protein